MKSVAKVVGAPFRALGLVPGKVKLPAPLPTATRDDAADAARRDDEIRRRKGSIGNQLLGVAGAEATGVGQKTLTGQ